MKKILEALDLDSKEKGALDEFLKQIEEKDTPLETVEKWAEGKPKGERKAFAQGILAQILVSSLSHDGQGEINEMFG